jgi:AraC-like DNA-binding protein
MRLVRPFLKIFGRDPRFPKELLDPLWAMDPDERMPMTVSLELLRGGIAITGDENIGLKAAAEVERGDYGVLEYVARSAPTLGAATEILGRYLALVSDAVRFTLEVKDGRAQIRLESTVVLPRANADFQSAAFFWASRLMMGEDAVNHPVEVWFEHTEPADLSEYGQAFLGNKVMFGMPWNGFVFDAALLDQPMPGADDKLHVLIRKHADALLEELPRAQSFTQRVRELLLKELEGGNPSAVRIASALHMSGRTLTRRLEDEGTTFKDLLDDLRKSLSLRYVGSTDLGLSEIAFLLGFSQSAAFHRAFKRWTAQTPLEYRRARRG